MPHDGRQSAGTRVPLVSLVLVLGIVLGAGCGGSGAGGPGVDSLLVTDSTVRLGLATMVADTFQLPASCGASVPVDCPDGVPGPAVPLPAVLTSDSVWSLGAAEYAFTLDVQLKTVTDIPLTLAGAACGLALDSQQGTSTDVTFAGTATFVRLGADSIVGELDLVPTQITGLEASDVTINGSATCLSAGLSLGGVQALLQGGLGAEVRLCAAPGTAVFKHCPAAAATPLFDRRRAGDGAVPGDRGERGG